MSPDTNSSLAELIASLPESQRRQILSGLTEEQYESIAYDWRVWARANQLPPEGDWNYWLLMAGRGFGKTRTGAETVRKMTSEGYRRIHLVGATAADVRDVMITGESGLLSCYPPSERPLYEPSKRLITFANGAQAVAFSADEPERLRGPQCDCFWADEVAAWRFAQDAWDNLMFGFRLGNRPRGIITTTPKPIKLVKDILRDPATVVTSGSSYENKSNLAPAFFSSIIRKYEGTRLGRQELLAELLEDIPGALWTRPMIDASRVQLSDLPKCVRVVVAIDPAVSAGEEADETGIIVAGIDHKQHIYVIADGTTRSSPRDWAYAACRLFLRWDCDRMVAEVNNGGDLVEANIRGVHPGIPYRSVRASRGKYVRAEPVAGLYEQGRVHHVGFLPELEEQMCSYVPGLETKSPDRMDALVWAVYDLLLQVQEQAIVTYDTGYAISPI
ncbi:MAG: terminase family protein [Acidobacteriota bacterium]